MLFRCYSGAISCYFGAILVLSYAISVLFCAILVLFCAILYHFSAFLCYSCDTEGPLRIHLRRFILSEVRDLLPIGSAQGIEVMDLSMFFVFCVFDL